MPATWTTSVTYPVVEPPTLLAPLPPHTTFAWRAGQALGALPVHDDPADPEPAFHLDATTILGTPTVVLIHAERDDGWAEVWLPGRPNGRRGWVRLDNVSVYGGNARVEVDLARRTLEVFDGDTSVLRSEIAVGTPENPTPSGFFYVTDAVQLADPGGPWGPFALGLSARSDTITEFNGGDGIIGIHGTNRPRSIGEAASLGCVRLPNDVVVQLADLVPVGTPVLIES